MNPPATVAPPPNYDQLKSAVLGAATNAGNGASPLGSFPEIANLYAAPTQVASQRLASATPDYNTGVDANQAAKQAALDVQKRKDMQDPNKYQQVKLPDGGFAFIAPDGTKVSAYDYANIAGTSPDKLLKDSENPIDIGFVQDYKNLQDYINAKLNSNHDDNAKTTAEGIEKTVLAEQGIDLAKMPIADVIQKLKDAYPTVYGGTKPGVQSGTTLLPPANALSPTDSLPGN